MLTADELTEMRSTLNVSLPDTAQVQRKSLMSDGVGGFTESWSIVATVPCRVSPAGRFPDERVIAERLTAKSVWTITMPAETDIKPADRVEIGLWVFEVVAVMARSDEIARRVVCVEVV